LETSGLFGSQAGFCLNRVKIARGSAIQRWKLLALAKKGETAVLLRLITLFGLPFDFFHQQPVAPF